MRAIDIPILQYCVGLYLHTDYHVLRQSAIAELVLTCIQGILCKQCEYIYPVCWNSLI